MEIDENVVEACARLAHEINRAYCRALGDESHKPWEEAPDWQTGSLKSGVRAKLKNPDITPAESHEKWREHKAADGWVYGPVKDPERKTHPCMVDYDALPPEDKAKDHLFAAAVHEALRLRGPEAMRKIWRVDYVGIDYVVTLSSWDEQKLLDWLRERDGAGPEECYELSAVPFDSARTIHVPEEGGTVSSSDPTLLTLAWEALDMQLPTTICTTEI